MKDIEKFMKVSKEFYEEIKESLVDDCLRYCNVCEVYFIVRNTDDGIINERVCPCCGVCGDDNIEVVEDDEE